MEIVKFGRFRPNYHENIIPVEGIRVNNWFGDKPVKIGEANTKILPNLDEITAHCFVPREDKVQMLSIALSAGLLDLQLSDIAILEREKCELSNELISFRHVLQLQDCEAGVFHVLYNAKESKFEGVAKIDPSDVLPHR